jgi:hypothetical protein
MEFPELPFDGDPDPAGELDVPEQDYLTPEQAAADDTVDSDETE